jgi:hypothetical protein
VCSMKFGTEDISSIFVVDEESITFNTAQKQATSEQVTAVAPPCSPQLERADASCALMQHQLEAASQLLPC